MQEIDSILKELSTVKSNICTSKINEFVKTLNNAPRIYLSGEGRSGLMVSAFANRLTQMNFVTHLASEITAPAIRNHDLLIFNSATGTSNLLISQAEAAKSKGAIIWTFTASKNAPLAKLSDHIFLIQTQTKDSKVSSIQPMGSLYEQYSLITFDAIVLYCIHNKIISNKEMRATHSNLE